MDKDKSPVLISCETVEWAFRCPRQWSDMAESDDPCIRFCSHCNKSVHRAYSVEELNNFTKQSLCVAWSNAPEERPSNLQEIMLIGLLRPKKDRLNTR